MKNKYFNTLKDNGFLPYTIEMNGKLEFTIVGKKGRFQKDYYTIYQVKTDFDGKILIESVIKSSRKISDLTHRTKDIYYTDGYVAMCGNVEVIRAYVGGELRVLQGMDRMKTIEKANIDCPYIIIDNKWNINNVPKLFSSNDRFYN